MAGLAELDEAQVTFRAAASTATGLAGAAEWRSVADDSDVPVAPVTALTGRQARRQRLPLFNGQGVTPFVEMDRPAWAELAESTPLPLTAAEIERLRSLGDPIDLDEVQTIYLPLSRLLNMYVGGVDALHQVTTTFLRERTDRTPFVIGVAGSVAVGKSTTSRLLREMLGRWPGTPRVELVTTDGFLYPNAVLEERNLMHRKGFPESYDRRALLRFVVEVKSGAEVVRAPRYSHLTYDILPGEEVVVRRPDVLIVEGLNVLQPASLDDTGRSVLALPDFFDFSIYVDANPLDVRRWYIERFLRLRSTAFTNPNSYLRRYADLTDDEAVETANRIWSTINEPNLVQNIQPTRGRATLVMTKGSDHNVSRIRLRKL
jgi:type I pantothenate kinase